MNFDDTNEEYPDRAETDSVDRICPWCNTRPLVKRKDATSCGNKECNRKRSVAYLAEYRTRPENKQRKKEWNAEYYQRSDVRERERERAAARADTPQFKAYHKEYRQRGYVKEKKREHARKAYQCPERRARLAERGRAYSQRPEVKAARLARQRTPEAKAKQRERYNRPEVKERIQEYNQRPEVKAAKIARRRTPEAKAQAREYSQRPDVSAKRLERQRRRSRRPDVVEKERVRGRLRGRPFSKKNCGGPVARWEMQRRMCALGWSEVDGLSYRSAKPSLDVDHLVPVALLRQIDIIEKSVYSVLDNMWFITTEKNRGLIGKFDKPLHHWLAEIGEPAPVVDMGRQWYESVIAIIVAKQQAIDPTYELTPERRQILGLGD